MLSFVSELQSLIKRRLYVTQSEQIQHRNVSHADAESGFPQSLTLLHGGVQLSDLDGEPIDAILQGVRSQIKCVGFIKQLAEYVLRMLTYRPEQTHEKRNKHCDMRCSLFQLKINLDQFYILILHDTGSASLHTAE